MIKASTDIETSPDVVFALTQDYAKRTEWDSFLREARVLPPHTKPDVGVRTYCRAWNGIGLETQYVTFRSPEVVAIKLTKPQWIFREFAATWRFKAVSSGTQVTFIYDLKTGPRFLKHLVNVLMAVEMRRRLSDLKTYLEQVK